jgi:hypothetical protein
MRRLFWIGVGAGVAVLVVRKGRGWLAQAVPEPAAGAVDTAISLGRAVSVAREQFRAGWAEKEAELMAALVGDRDVADLAAGAADRRAALRARFAGDADRRTAARIAEDWAGQPTDDPDDDDGYAF